MHCSKHREQQLQTSQRDALHSQMAPIQLEPPFMAAPYFSLPTCHAQCDIYDESDDFNDYDPLSPRTLYAQSFDSRPTSSASAPRRYHRKNLRTMAGYEFCDAKEFDELPLAVRRKYFSTLERLRFAQSARSDALNELPIQRNRKPSLADRRGLNIPAIEAPQRKPSSARRAKRSQRQQSVSSFEASWFLTLPEKIQQKQFTREQQVVLAGRLRESVILDAADEAVYKASRVSRTMAPITHSLTAMSPRRGSFDSQEEDRETSRMTAAMYESFRWMDEEKDLDLKLALDDYHANLDGYIPPVSKGNRRPSFRRQISISKMPFGRNSLQSPIPSSPRIEAGQPHARKKSRTMSLITPRHAAKASVSSIDPNATHYQDPEARLKLRVYLASPQKFDEAIEFGFPSMDGVADGPDKENSPPRTSRDINCRKSESTKKPPLNLLYDLDAASLFEDDVSMMEPDSPVTPMDKDLEFRPHLRSSTTDNSKASSSAEFSQTGGIRPTPLKHEVYTQSMASNREMTLRMTLTRPDLRSDETAIYGWQTSKTQTREGPPGLEEIEEHDVRGPFGGVDGWGPEKGDGVVKKFWKKMRNTS